ncbi:MAG: SGNH/GDSL hydrolase family protein [Bacteroidota bacterium]
MGKTFTHISFTLRSILLLLACCACRPNIVSVEPSLGVLNVQRVMAFGDGYTAGFTNTARDYSEPTPEALLMGWHEEGQAMAFPLLLSGQLSISAGEAVNFETPFSPGNGSGQLSLESMTPPECSYESAQPKFGLTQASPTWQEASSTRLYQNLGVPGLKVGDIQKAGYQEQNPFFKQLNYNGDQHYLALLEQAQPSLFTLWLGMEDVLAYGLRGGQDSSFYPTAPTLFAQNFAALLHLLVEVNPNEAVGLIGTIPDLRVLPYFSATPRTFTGCNGIERPLYIQTSGQNEAVVAQETDFILLPAKDLIGSITDPGNQYEFGLSANNPIPDYWVLDQDESEVVVDHINAYNQSIDSLITSFNNQLGRTALKTVNMVNFYYLLSLGVLRDGLEINNQYLSGGIFGLDGIYLTPRGNAMMANRFIEAINETTELNAQIPELTITDYVGVVYP